MTPAYVLDDPRPIARSAPYTYFLPSAERLAAIEPGDLVQLLFRSLALSPKYAVERMWVLVQLVAGDGLVGVLESTPFDMPGLEKGERVRFERHHSISVTYKDASKEDRIPHPRRREYWERCLVDQCVLDEDVPVGFLYREVPESIREGDKYPDSGWRIRGDARGITPEDLDARKCTFVALGAVLNRDDTWLSLIDEPIGSRFVRNFATSTFEPQSDSE